MIAVYKYPLQSGSDWVDMPAGAEILTVQLQRDLPCVWARVNTQAESRPRQLRVVATGQEIEGYWKYIGTFHYNNGALVYHLFEV